MKLIKYEIFRQRKNFNPLILFKKNKDITYDQFKEFFESRLVESPDINYYTRVKNKFNENNDVNVVEENKTEINLCISDQIETQDKLTTDDDSDNKKIIKKQSYRKLKKVKDANN